jgi:hypothetical protein
MNCAAAGGVRSKKGRGAAWLAFLLVLAGSDRAAGPGPQLAPPAPPTSAAFSSPSSSLLPEEARLLLIALDGVPYTAVRDAIDAAHRAGRELFAGYAGPVPLVSSFPSTTHPAMAGILEPLGIGPSPGY